MRSGRRRNPGRLRSEKLEPGPPLPKGGGRRRVTAAYRPLTPRDHQPVVRELVLPLARCQARQRT